VHACKIENSSGLALLGFFYLNPEGVLNLTKSKHEPKLIFARLCNAHAKKLCCDLCDIRSYYLSLLPSRDYIINEKLSRPLKQVVSAEDPPGPLFRHVFINSHQLGVIPSSTPVWFAGIRVSTPRSDHSKIRLAKIYFLTRILADW
jgi:hypothetical protein